jgi:tetrahydromethanopterin S-methyltransferase subunit G
LFKAGDSRDGETIDERLQNVERKIENVEGKLDDVLELLRSK